MPCGLHALPAAGLERYNEGMSVRTRGAAVDCYDVLGVAPTASSVEIRRAYRERARRLHPDVNRAADAAERFAALAEAYDTLSDPMRRRAYDLSRSAGTANTGSSRPAAWASAGVPEVARQNGHRGPAMPVEPSLRGPDVWQTVRLSLREAAFGTNRTIEVPRREVCVRCRGTGAAPGGTVRHCGRCHGTGRGPRTGEECPRCHGNGGIPTVPCPFCGGLGRVASMATFPLHFPPAIEDGEVLRIKNEGDPGPQGGPRGDLRVRIDVEPDPVLRRRGSEVYADLTISPDQAERGGRVDVPTLHGTARLRLPKGVAAGDAFVLRGRGLRLKGRWRRGDQHVTVHIGGDARAAGAV